MHVFFAVTFYWKKTTTKLFFSTVKIKDHYTRLHNHLQMLAIKVSRLVSQSPCLSHGFVHVQYTDDVVLRAVGLDSESHCPSSVRSITQSHHT